MSEEPCQVDWHCIQVVYFDNEDRVPSGSDYAKVWSGMARLGNRRVHGAFWHDFRRDPKMKLRSIPLGSPDVIAPLLAVSDESIGGGGVSQDKNAARPTLDCDFYLAMGKCSRCEFGPTPPYFQLAISNQWAEEAGAQTVLEIMRDNFEIFDAQAPFYGFIDLSRPEESTAGHSYGPIRLHPISLASWTQQGLWVQVVNEGRDEARGIFWGNYFGPRILEKLGGRERFLERFREFTTLKDGTRCAMEWEFTNGVFVGLSLDPLNCTPGELFETHARHNFVNLHNDLSRHSVLMGAHGHTSELIWKEVEAARQRTIRPAASQFSQGEVPTDQGHQVGRPVKRIKLINKSKRKRLLKELSRLPEPQIVPIDRFFDGNNDPGSIGCNLPEHPGMDVFRDVLVGLTSRSDIEAVYAQIAELDPGEDSWPFADTILVVGNVSTGELRRLLAPLQPDEIGPADTFGVPTSVSDRHRTPILAAWWD